MVSLKLAAGTITFLFPIFLASIHIGKMPGICFSLPSRESSPIKIVSSISSIKLRLIRLVLKSIPIAIDKSKIAPPFLTFAGDKLIMIFLDTRLNPVFLIAVITLSLDSFRLQSGSPTIVYFGIPLETST